MKITVNPFDKKSIAAALKQVKQYKKDFKAKEQEFLRRVAELGVTIAGEGFSLADYDGVNDVVVQLKKTGDGYAVVASGETVGFIEFGTGVKYPEWSGAGTEYTPPPHGSYGKGRGKNPHGWWFKQGEGAMARHTYGNPPAEAMLTARDQMVENVFRIAREVWR